jgi:hypothetical protein
MLPNAIAMLSIFAILCEAWLGVEPYLDPWRCFYSGMYQKDNLFVGSVSFTLKTRKNYIVFLVKSSWKGFVEKWFYIDLWEKNVFFERTGCPALY